MQGQGENKDKENDNGNDKENDNGNDKDRDRDWDRDRDRDRAKEKDKDKVKVKDKDNDNDKDKEEDRDRDKDKDRDKDEDKDRDKDKGIELHVEVIFAFEFDLITLSWKLSTLYWKRGIFFKQSFFMDSEKGILLIKYLEWWNVAVRLDLFFLSRVCIGFPPIVELFNHFSKHNSNFQALSVPNEQLRAEWLKYPVGIFPTGQKAQEQARLLFIPSKVTVFIYLISTE